jgi:hypothetical protein
MRLSVLMPLAAAAAFSFTAPAAALTVVQDTGNLLAYSSNVDMATRTITVWETWGPKTSNIVDIKFTDFPLGRRDPWTLIKYVTNETGANFKFFQHELLNSDKSQSDNLDGLSFAQNGLPPVPRVSDVFSDVMVDELEERDFLFFSGGILKTGETGRFEYGLTVTDPDGNNPFYIRQSGVVPEPATWAMLITGFGLVGFAMRRRKATIASVAA